MDKHVDKSWYSCTTACILRVYIAHRLAEDQTLIRQPAMKVICEKSRIVSSCSASCNSKCSMHIERWIRNFHIACGFEKFCIASDTEKLMNCFLLHMKVLKLSICGFAVCLFFKQMKIFVDTHCTHTEVVFKNNFKLIINLLSPYSIIKCML